MTTKAFTFFLVALAFAPLTSIAVSAQPASADQPHYTHRELKHLIRDARTPEQYRALASWFRSQQQIFNDKAAAEKTEWARREAITASPVLKYPTPADSAHNLYDYYLAKANEMANRARTYEQRLQ